MSRMTVTAYPRGRSSGRCSILTAQQLVQEVMSTAAAGASGGFERDLPREPGG
jgi:hypothetical protein